MPRHPRVRPALAALLATLLLAACRADDASGPSTVTPPPVASVRVTPATLTLVQGETQQLTAMPLSATGQELPDSAVTWSLEGAPVVAVSATGSVTAQAIGNATLIARSGIAETRVQVGVSEVPAARVILSIATLDLDEGQVTTIAATVLDAQDRPLPGRVVEWSTEDLGVATISTAGNLTAIGEGSTRIVARHGTLEATADLQVAPVFGADLLFTVLDPQNFVPAIHRMDPRSSGAPGQPVFGSNGSWQPAVSPDGARLVFTCTAGGPGICVSNIDGSGFVVLTDGDLSYEDEPAWSPDGQRIVFRRWPQGATPGPWNPTDIWVMDATGANQVNLTADAALQHAPAWAPVAIAGASRIAFVQDSLVDGSVTSRIASMRADGSDRRYETAFGLQVDLNPTWSPDGRALVFTRAGGAADNDLWRLDLGTGAEREFLPYTLGGAQLHPAWSPDGRYLAFTSNHEEGPNRDYRPQLYTVRADGSRLFRRSVTSVDKADPAWVPVP